MSLWKIAWRSMQQRKLASLLTGISMALGVAVMIAVLVLNSLVVKQFDQNPEGFGLVIGPKSGPMELVLNSVYYLGQPQENIPYAFYKEFVDGEYADYTKFAIPICLGDSYEANGQTFRIVGTIPDLFDKTAYRNTEEGDPVYYEFEEGGRNFKQENFFEAVIGHVVARQSGLKVGDKINATHGIGGEVHAEDSFTVTGILKPTETTNDRVVFINMEGFYLLEKHSLSQEQADRYKRAMVAEFGEKSKEKNDKTTESVKSDDGHQPLPEDLREVTSILFTASFDPYYAEMEKIINKGQIAMAVSPVRYITQMLDSIIGPIGVVLLVLTILIIIVASISILVSIYNSMNERSRDIAVMRALGARRFDVMAIILTESIMLSLFGGIAGIVLGHGLVAIASPLVEARTGVAMHVFHVDPWEWIIIPSLILLASIIGLLPAFTAYRTDVAESL